MIEGKIVLTDYSSCGFITQDKSHRSTKIAMAMKAPEWGNSQSYGMEVDVWSIGILAIELAKGSTFITSNTGTSSRNVQPLLASRNVENSLINTNRFDSHGDNNFYQDFMERCLKENPSQRPSVSELL